MRPMLQGEMNFPVCLAPMVGLSHVAVRELVRSYLPANAVTLWPTEMLNSRRLPRENLGATPETYRGENETHLVPQILGNEEQEIAASVARLQDWGVSGIDINMGCPVRKALSHNYGVALMGDPVYAREVVAMTVRHAKVPVSVKLRAGLQSDRGYLLDFVCGLEQAGASWLTLHPRTAEQKRRGRADWSQIAEVRAKVNCAVIGNGDIQTSEDVQVMLRETGCDAVMAGRALLARPWLLWQIGEDLGWPAPPGRAGAAPRTRLEEGAAYGEALLFLIERLQTYFTLEQGLRRLRFFLRTSSPWLLYGHALTSAMSRAQTYEACAQTVREFFLKPQEMVPRTELRQ